MRSISSRCFIDHIKRKRSKADQIDFILVLIVTISTYPDSPLRCFLRKSGARQVKLANRQPVS
jgi:hypothetical protein